MIDDQIPSLIYFVVLLIALGGYVVVEVIRSPARGTRNLIAWGLIFLAVASGAALWDQMKGGMITPAQTEATGGRIEIPMARDGRWTRSLAKRACSIGAALSHGETETTTPSSLPSKRKPCARSGLRAMTSTSRAPMRASSSVISEASPKVTTRSFLSKR